MNWYTISEASSKFKVSKQALYKRIKKLEANSKDIIIINGVKKVSEQFMQPYNQPLNQIEQPIKLIEQPVIAEEEDNRKDVEMVTSFMEELKMQLREKQTTIEHLQDVNKAQVEQLQHITGQLENANREKSILVSKVLQLQAEKEEQREESKEPSKTSTTLFALLSIIAAILIILLSLYVSGR